jgi:hypothetical protein
VSSGVEELPSTARIMPALYNFGMKYGLAIEVNAIEENARDNELRAIINRV